LQWHKKNSIFHDHMNVIGVRRAFGEFFAGALVAPEAPARKKGLGLPFKIVAACLALTLLGFAARGSLRAWRESQLRGALAQTVASHPELAAFPLTLMIDHGDARATLSGLAPTQSDADALATGLSGANTGYQVAANIGVVATTASLTENRARADASLASLRADLATITTRLDALDHAGAATGALAQATREEQVRLVGAASEASQKLAAIEAGLGDLRARVDAPKARLAALIAGLAVFFDRDRPIDQPGLNDRLDAIADVLKTTGLSLRVAGYSDDTGSDAINQSLSRHRAEVVADMLASRGVSREHLLIIGRAAADPIAAATPGLREKNRRAVLEIPYDGETAP